MKNNSFCIFVLVHKRAGRIKTLKTLEKANNTNDIFLIADDNDNDLKLYSKENVKDVLVFNKNEVLEKTDTIDNFKKMNVVVYARNECHEFAKKLGYKYFLVLDDDYTNFTFRFEKENTLSTKEIKNFDKVCDIFIDYLEKTNALSVAFAQGGDYIGGINGGIWKKKILRKCMNSFFCKTSRPFKFTGSINEDVNAYVTLGAQGHLFLTLANICLLQTQTQSNAGGLTDIYLESGTYVKSFYSVITAPSSVVTSKMGTTNKRYHHKIKWNNAVPKIIDERHKKRKKGEEC